VTIYVNGHVLTERALSMKETDRLEEAIRKRGWTILGLSRDGDDYEYFLKEKVAPDDLAKLEKSSKIETTRYTREF